MATNYDSINAQLRYDQGYQDALAGRINSGQFPTGPDGLVLPNFRDMNARYYAEQKYGRDRIGGAQDRSGNFYDPNADHWYSDPRVLGPIAVAAAGGLAGAGLLPGAPSAAAAGGGASSFPASGLNADGTLAASLTHPAGMVPGGTAAGVAAGTGGLGSIAPIASGAAGSAAANAATSGGSILSKLMSPSGIASLAGLIPALMGGGSGGNVSQAQEALLNEALKRSQRVDPLHQAVTQLAFSRLPDSARQGISLTGK